MIFLSSLFIIIITSIPVYSKTPLLKDLIIKIHGGPLALPEDPEFLYNKVMILVAIILGLLTAISQYLKYKSTPRSVFLKKIIYPTLISSIITIALAVVYPYTFYKHGAGFLGAIYTATFCMIYSFVANAMYISVGLKNKISHAGGSISHAGFALMIIGMLISSSNKIVISDSKVNGINVPVSKDPMSKKQEDPTENLTLIRQVPTTMGDFEVTYQKDSSGNEKGRKFYSLEFKNKKNTLSENFILKPDVYLMKDNNMSSNPDTKSFLTKDIFTYISFALNGDNNADTGSFKETEIAEGQKGYYGNGYFILNKVVKNPNNEKYHFNKNDIALMADITFVSKDSMHYKAMPAVVADSLGIMQIDDTVYAQNLFVKFIGVSEGRKIKIGVKESQSLIDFITVKSYVFPYINLVWLGLIIMAIGIFISMIKKLDLSRSMSIFLLTIISSGLIYMFLFAN
jgi:cytochrome c-type biogenesis protein CcmF